MSSSDSPPATCAAHGEATKISCAECAAPVCPRCLVRTDVGLKCEACASAGAATSAAPGATGRRSRWPMLAAGAGLVALAVVGALVLVGSDEGEPKPGAGPAIGTWEDLTSLTTLRGTASAVVLDDGRVLVAGGGVSAIPLAGAELYADGAWEPTGDLVEARRGHRAVVLDDGRVLVAGGVAEGRLLSSVEVYDPEAGRWERAGDMTVARVGHAAVRLADGRVLVVGGTTPAAPAGSGGGQTIRPTAEAEIFDPETGRWEETAPMGQVRFEPTVSLLSDGRVVVAGGLGTGRGEGTSFVPQRTVELFDPAVERFTGAAELNEGRTNHAATVLEDGRVLVVGGLGGAAADVAIRSAEVYDPGGGGWDRIAPVAQARSGATATLLDDGRVLVAGGEAVDRGRRRALASAELLDPGESVWRSAGSMSCSRSEHEAVRLDDGSVMVTAGDAISPGEPPVARGCVDRYVAGPGEDAAGAMPDLHDPSA